MSEAVAQRQVKIDQSRRCQPSRKDRLFDQRRFGPAAGSLHRRRNTGDTAAQNDHIILFALHIFPR